MAGPSAIVLLRAIDDLDRLVEFVSRLSGPSSGSGPAWDVYVTNCRGIGGTAVFREPRPFSLEGRVFKCETNGEVWTTSQRIAFEAYAGFIPQSEVFVMANCHSLDDYTAIMQIVSLLLSTFNGVLCFGGQIDIQDDCQPMSQHSDWELIQWPSIDSISLRFRLPAMDDEVWICDFGSERFFEEWQHLESASLLK